MLVPIKEPTGRLRPEDETRPARPHGHAITTSHPKYTESGTPRDINAAANAYQCAIGTLEKRFVAASKAQPGLGASGNQLVRRSDVLSLCQQVGLPINDDIVYGHVRQCKPDADGRIRVDDVIAALRSYRVGMLPLHPTAFVPCGACTRAYRVPRLLAV